MKKKVNGVEVEMTPAEISARLEQEAEFAARRAEEQKTQYKRDRLKAYPSIQDQLDQLYHLGYDGWKAEIKKIKDRYPKPE